MGSIYHHHKFDYKRLLISGAPRMVNLVLSEGSKVMEDL